MSIPNKSSGAHLVEVDSDRAGQRLDNFLAGHLKGVPKSAVYRMIRTGQVRINGGRCKAATRVEEGDAVRIPPAKIREKGEFVISETVCRQVRMLLFTKMPTCWSSTSPPEWLYIPEVVYPGA